MSLGMEMRGDVVILFSMHRIFKCRRISFPAVGAALRQLLSCGSVQMQNSSRARLFPSLCWPATSSRIIWFFFLMLPFYKKWKQSSLEDINNIYCQIGKFSLVGTADKMTVLGTYCQPVRTIPTARRYWVFSSSRKTGPQDTCTSMLQYNIHTQLSPAPI